MKSGKIAPESCVNPVQNLAHVSFESLLVKECKLDAGVADALIEAKPGTTTGEVFSTWGGDRRSKEAKDNQVDNVNLKRTKGGNDPEYLTARIARDFPQILARMKSGEFKSVRAAAKEAGIVKDPTPLQLLHRAWKKATEQAGTVHLELISQIPIDKILQRVKIKSNEPKIAADFESRVAFGHQAYKE